MCSAGGVYFGKIKRGQLWSERGSINAWSGTSACTGRKLVDKIIFFGLLTGGQFFWYAVTMKQWFVLLGGCVLLGACAGMGTEGAPHYRVTTDRETPYYLGTDAEEVEDTCPGNDILKQYSCSRKQEDGYSCFDVYLAQGSPINNQRYTLLQERIERQAVSPQPQCPIMEPTCEAFLQALNYNLEFSWYLVNFPTSSFPQCRETYDCKSIDCYLPPDPASGVKESTLVSCVYKRNQLFFVGSEVTCTHTQR